jgi:hypothetical protein
MNHQAMVFTFLRSVMNLGGRVDLASVFKGYKTNGTNSNQG